MKHPEFDDGPSPRRFSTGELVAAAIGGVAVGALTVALWPKRAAVPTGAVLPSGAVAPRAVLTPQAAQPAYSPFRNGEIVGPPSPTFATARQWPRAVVKGAPQWRQFASADALLSVCPSPEEIAQIHADFDVRFDKGIDTSFPSKCNAAAYDQPRGVLWNFYNALRLMKALPFDAPMPIIGVGQPVYAHPGSPRVPTTYLYDWFKSLGITIHFTKDADKNVGGNMVISLRSEDWTWAPDLSAPRAHWSDPPPDYRAMYWSWIIRSPGIILHESFHTIPGGAKVHSCGQGAFDSSLSYGGGYGISYWYYVWLAQHTGAFLTTEEKLLAFQYSQNFRGPAGSFCDENGAAPNH